MKLTKDLWQPKKSNSKFIPSNNTQIFKRTNEKEAG